MFLRTLLIAAVSVLALGSQAPAGEIRQQPRAVVELFTSQGCASCPAADAMFSKLGEDPAIIALAYHVDYWDYIGWTDTFGSADNSRLQRDYADSWGSSRIFTPQMVVNGTSGVVASRAIEVDGAVGTAALALPVRLTVSGDEVNILISPRPGQADAVVWLVSFLDEAQVKIERGENEGKTIAYTQIVTGRQAIGMYDAAGGAYIKLPLDQVIAAPANGFAVIVQEESGDKLPGPIVGAASYIH